MRTITVTDVEEWRAEARQLLRDAVPPEGVLWIDSHRSESSLPFDRNDGVAAQQASSRQAATRVPAKFIELARVAACHRDRGRWAILYRVLWRIQTEGRQLLDVVSDPDVHALLQMVSQVHRDEHRMRAFVRFTRVTDDSGERYVAYYEPDHRIVRMAAPFFADRFASMRWSILTPDLCAHWDGATLAFTDGTTAAAVAGDDEIQQLWRTYYAAVFNPARVNLRATLRDMPLRRWAGLPEAALIPSLLHSAHERTAALPKSAAGSARPFVPHTSNLDALRAAVPACRGCDLYEKATHAVFGEGSADAAMVLVGEQPGDAEDLAGRPFVGPAGQVLDRALAAAGIDRSTVYITNAVKHFSWEPRGKQRIHKKPRASEMRACRPWLEAELHGIGPRCVVCLGSTAAQSLLGPQVRVLEARGRIVDNTAWAPSVVVTIHPSAVLRADDGERYFEMLVSDLQLAATRLGGRNTEVR